MKQFKNYLLHGNLLNSFSVCLCGTYIAIIDIINMRGHSNDVRHYYLPVLYYLVIHFLIGSTLVETD